MNSHLNQHSGNRSSQGGAGPIRLWYRLTSPPEPAESASFEERDLFRRGRTGSQISITLFILVLISFPAAFAGSNSLLVSILAIDLVILTLAMVLNRLGKVSVAGILVVLCMSASPIVNILTTPGGVSTAALPIFGLLVLPLMCAVSFLSPGWVFIVALGNCLFTAYVLLILPSTGDLHTLLRTALPGIITPILISQVIVSIVAFLWVRGAKEALRRADRAEVIADLQRKEVLRQEQEVEQKHLLDQAIEQILQTLQAFSNGDVNVQVPTSQNSVLFRVAYSLNTLFARLRSARLAERQLKETQQENYNLRAALFSHQGPDTPASPTELALQQLAEHLRRGSLPGEPTGTAVDEIVKALKAPHSGTGMLRYPSNRRQ